MPPFDFPKAHPACVCRSIAIFRACRDGPVSATLAEKQPTIDAIKNSGMRDGRLAARMESRGWKTKSRIAIYIADGGLAARIRRGKLGNGKESLGV